MAQTSLHFISLSSARSVVYYFKFVSFHLVIPSNNTLSHLSGLRRHKHGSLHPTLTAFFGDKTFATCFPAAR